MKTLKKQLLGYHKKQKRIWINHGTIVAASLNAGDTVEHVYDEVNGNLIIRKSNEGGHKIANTHKGGVIDIVNGKISAMFRDNEFVDVISTDGQIIVTGHHAENKIKAREEALLRRVRTGEPLRKGGAFVGMGLLCRSVHRGLKRSGVAVKQRFANEYNPIPAEVNMAGNEIWEDAFEDALFSVDDLFEMPMDTVPSLDLLVMGMPCPPFSQLNTQRAKAGHTDVFHPDSGTVFQPTLELIRHANPAIVVLEQSPRFAGSTTDHIMSDVMRRFGYLSASTIVTGTAFGDFERRERLCTVWYSKGLEAICLEDLPLQCANERTLADILEPIDLQDKRWGRRPYLERKAEQKHNGHGYCITQLSATQVPTCGANYHKVQPDSLMISHPNDPLVTRTLTPSEHCNLRDVAGPLKRNVEAVAKGQHYAQRTNRSSASEAQSMLGNSVAPKAWISVGYRLGEWLKTMVGINDAAMESASNEPECNQIAFCF
ncbi:MAG: hypothetical protein C9356_11815 [Oleiphilus sp.]|nr:MAG: hypothetical protein C9356_11815 [Oleiphilus sp.]